LEIARFAHGKVVLPLAALLLVILVVSSAASVVPSADAAAAAGPSGRVCDRVAAPSGSDGNRGTLRSPFRTPERLVRALAPGRTGCVRRGVYRTGILNVERGGARGAPIRLRSFPGERARLVGIVQVRRGANHVVFSRLAFEGTGGANTIKIYARNIVVERSNITNRWRGQSCMILGSDEVGAAVRTIVRGNRFHECGNPDNDNKDHAIYAANLQGGRIVGNRFWNHTAYAIHLYPNADRNLVARNVIDGGPPSIRGGIVLASEDQWSSSGNVIERNVIAYATEWNISTNWNGPTGTDNVVRYNCVWAGREGNIETNDGGVRAYGNIVANPRFVNRAARDYRLRAASRCRAPLRG
jgi:Right handed beta helix region